MSDRRGGPSSNAANRAMRGGLIAPVVNARVHDQRELLDKLRRKMN
jgi:hypothetical protein